MDFLSPSRNHFQLSFQGIQNNFLGKALMRLLKLGQIQQLYSPHADLEGASFISALLQQLSITYTLDPKELKNLPASGSFIAVANHPYGALDGLLMLEILSTARPDFKMMANSVLSAIPNLESMFLAVDPFQGKAKKNIPALRQALIHLQEGMPLGIFPAGEVSNWQVGTQQIVDRAWQPSMGKLIVKANVPVVPIHFGGHNSLTFLLMSLVHPFLQTARLPAELLNKRGHQVPIRIGKPIQPREWADLSKPEVLSFVRTKTYALSFPSSAKVSSPEVLPIAQETDKELIKQELAQLPANRKLLSHLTYEVYMARAGQIPNTLRELGRLREITFREVGEGTQKELDLDQYDHYYHHLFVYDRQAELVVGAYRLGKGKEILKKYGKNGFYLHSLFKIKRELVPLLKSSLELGRSFVRPEYQKKNLPLLLLWKGLSLFLQDKLSYRYLIGPVSISNWFSHLSQSLMVHYIQENFYDAELARFVRPRKQFRFKPSLSESQNLLSHQLSGIASLDELIKEIEPQKQGLPPLLKRYLLQNARIISFNVDPAFSHSLDGFMVMSVENLPATTERIFTRIKNKES